MSILLIVAQEAQPDMARFGEIWTVELADQKVPRLVVSSDAYHAFAPDRVLTAVIDPGEYHSRTVYEHIDGIGTALLDLITFVSRSRLVDRVGELPPDRRADVGVTIRTLIGP